MPIAHRCIATKFTLLGLRFVYPEGYLRSDNSSDSAKVHTLTSKRGGDFLFVQGHLLRMHDKQIYGL